MARKRNDSLRELLEFVKRQIKSAHRETRALDGIQELEEALTNAIQDLKDNPGPSQTIGN